MSAAIHGDEIGGVEIIRRLLRLKALRRLVGTLIAVPVVNVYGFVAHSRYLPDRRDLNRAFPGSPTGSLTSRLADVFMREIVSNATHGIDLHTGALHRTNLPQVRVSLAHAEAERLSRAFGAPVVLDANLRDGSLRQAVLEQDLPMLVYEGGEALRFDEISIRAGLRGVVSVMRELEMLPRTQGRRRPPDPFVARSSVWVRAPESGVLRTIVRLGDHVEKGQELAMVSDPLGDESVPLDSPVGGLVIGRTQLPLVNAGDAVFHVASFEEPERVAERVGSFQEALFPDVLDDS